MSTLIELESACNRLIAENEALKKELQKEIDWRQGTIKELNKMGIHIIEPPIKDSLREKEMP